ncbi:MAG: riboflavin synthase [Dehalococcoidales bacterium]|nr:riboflavin synthase [Dehalococcoidales bacterium]
MFTGIVEEIGKVIAAPARKLAVAAREILPGMKLGNSIAVNGVCLTVTDFDNKSFAVDVMPETLRRTNLGLLRPGSAVNLERPLAAGGEVGGHFVQGHIDDTGKLAAVMPEGEALLMKFAAPPEVLRFTVAKGFIAVDGVSLTIVSKSAADFTISLVGFTRTHTILGNRKVGDLVNLEADVLGKYVAQMMAEKKGGLTADFLKEHGFMVN